MRVYIWLSIQNIDFAPLVAQRGGVGNDKSAGSGHETGTQMGTLAVDDVRGTTCWVCLFTSFFPGAIILTNGREIARIDEHSAFTAFS